MKIFKNFWSFINPLADVLGILGFFGISLRSINLTNVPWYVYIILILSSTVFIRIILRKFSEINNIYQDIKVDRNLEKISTQRSLQAVNESLPTTATVRRLYERACKRINLWAEDSIITSCNLYIDYSDSRWKKPMLQVVAYSEWKKEEGWFYEGSLVSEGYYENQLFSSKHYLSEQELFFVANSDWQRLVEKAFDAISSHLTNNCSIWIQDDTITIKYSQGSLEKSKEFKISEDFTKIISVK